MTWESHTIHIVGLSDRPRATRSLADGLAHDPRRPRRARSAHRRVASPKRAFRRVRRRAQRYVTSDRLISRSHFARFLVERGHAKTTRDVFKRYLRAGKPGYVEHAWATLAEAVSWIHAAGGQAVVAHPGRYRVTATGMRRLLGEFRDAGGDGIEVFTPSHTLAEAEEYARYARVFGLLASTGSRLSRSRREPARPRRVAAAAGGTRPGVVALVAVPRCPMRGKRTVFFLSDRTGITAEMLGNSLLTQFEEFDFQRVTIPFVDSPERVAEAIRQVNDTAAREGRRPLVISSVVDEAMSEDDPARRERAHARPLPGVHPAARSGARRQELARGRTLARHRQQPRVLRADGGDQLHAGARRRRDHARPRQGAGDPGRRVTLRQDADVALSRAAVRHPRRELSAHARRLRGPAPAGVGRSASREAVRPHDPAGAAARDPRGAPTREQVRLARELPLSKCARPKR